MSNRVSFGAALLILLLIAALLGGFAMEKVYDPAARMFGEAAEFALDENWQQALLSADQGRTRWIKYRSFAASLADQTPMDDVEKLMSEMTVFARCRDKEHFAATCAQLSVMCKAMGDAHKGSWWNLL